MKAVIFSIATFFSTFLGGFFAVKFKDRIHLIMAFSAGVLLGVVSFDLLPEIFEQAKTNKFATTEAMIALMGGFFLFHVLEKTILIHYAHEKDYVLHKHPQVGVISALALVGHSFMDGLSIGFGFQVSAVAGMLVALAVILHDFTDGMNTITLMLAYKNSLQKSKWFLLLDSLAPVLGAAATLFLRVSPHFLYLYLGFFAGFLIYIGASDTLPEAHSNRSSFKLIGLTLSGALLIFLITRFVH